MYNCYALLTREHAKNNDMENDEGLKTDGQGLP